MKPPTVTLVVNGTELSMGMLANSIAQFMANEELRIEILDDADLRVVSARTQKLLFDSDLLHFLSPSPWKYHDWRAFRGRTVVSLHHVHETESWWCEMPTPRMLVTHSDDAAAHIEDVCGRRADVVLPYGFDPTIFSTCSSDEKLRSRDMFGIAPDELVVGAFGNAATWRKGVPLLIDSLELLPKRDGVCLLLAGPGWDEHIHALEALVGRVVHAPAGDFAGMRQRYAALDVYLCTSLLEGGPLPVLEALACGVPVVSTDVGHVPDLIIDNGSNGRVVAKEAREIASALTLVLEEVEPGTANPEIAATVATRSWSALGERYRRFYLDLAADFEAPTYLNRTRRVAETNALRAVRGVVKRLRRVIRYLRTVSSNRSARIGNS